MLSRHQCCHFTKRVQACSYVADDVCADFPIHRPWNVFQQAKLSGITHRPRVEEFPQPFAHLTSSNMAHLEIRLNAHSPVSSWKRSREKYIEQILFPRSACDIANERLWKAGLLKRKLVWFQIRSHIVALTVDQININHQMYLCHFSRNCNIFQMCF